MPHPRLHCQLLSGKLPPPLAILLSPSEALTPSHPFLAAACAIRRCHMYRRGSDERCAFVTREYLPDITFSQSVRGGIRRHPPRCASMRCLRTCPAISKKQVITRDINTTRARKEFQGVFLSFCSDATEPSFRSIALLPYAFRPNAPLLEELFEVGCANACL
jgi:hypothetical protein